MLVAVALLALWACYVASHSSGEAAANLAAAETWRKLTLESIEAWRVASAAESEMGRINAIQAIERRAETLDTFWRTTEGKIERIHARLEALETTHKEASP